MTNPPPQEPYFPPQNPASPSPVAPGRRGGVVSGFVLGLVLAVIVGAILTVTKVMSFGSGATAVDTTPITLPEKLGDLQALGAAAAARNPAQAGNVAERLAKSQQLTADWYQRAFRGAAAAASTYTDAELTQQLTVIAVRAPAPGPTTGPVSDLALLRVAASPQIPELEVVGEVECLRMVTKMFQADEQVTDDDKGTSQCQRSDNTLTVYVIANPGNTMGQAGLTLVTNLTNDAFTAIKGG